MSGLTDKQVCSLVERSYRQECRESGEKFDQEEVSYRCFNFYKGIGSEVFDYLSNKAGYPYSGGNAWSWMDSVPQEIHSQAEKLSNQIERLRFDGDSLKIVAVV